MDARPSFNRRCDSPYRVKHSAGGRALEHRTFIKLPSGCMTRPLPTSNISVQGVAKHDAGEESKEGAASNRGDKG